MRIVLAKTEDGNIVCYRSNLGDDLSDGLMLLLQTRYMDGWYKGSLPAMDLAKRLIDSYYEGKPLMVEGEIVENPDYEGIVLDFLESRSGFAKEEIVILETEN